MEKSPAALATTAQNSQSSCAVHHTLSSHWHLSGSGLEAPTLCLYPILSCPCGDEEHQQPQPLRCSHRTPVKCIMLSAIISVLMAEYRDQRLYDTVEMKHCSGSTLSSAGLIEVLYTHHALCEHCIASGRLCLAMTHDIGLLVSMPFPAVTVYMKNSTGSTVSKSGLPESLYAPATSP